MGWMPVWEVGGAPRSPVPGRLALGFYSAAWVWTTKVKGVFLWKADSRRLAIGDLKTHDSEGDICHWHSIFEATT